MCLAIANHLLQILSYTLIYYTILSIVQYQTGVQLPGGREAMNDPMN